MLNCSQSFASLARTKLYEKRVQNLAAVLAAVERFLDFGDEAGYQRNNTPPPKSRANLIIHSVSGMRAAIGEMEEK